MAVFEDEEGQALERKVDPQYADAERAMAGFESSYQRSEG